GPQGGTPTRELRTTRLCSTHPAPSPGARSPRGRGQQGGSGPQVNDLVVQTAPSTAARKGAHPLRNPRQPVRADLNATVGELRELLPRQPLALPEALPWAQHERRS